MKIEDMTAKAIQDRLPNASVRVAGKNRISVQIGQEKPWTYTVQEASGMLKYLDHQAEADDAGRMKA